MSNPKDSGGCPHKIISIASRNLLPGKVQQSLDVGRVSLEESIELDKAHRGFEKGEGEVKNPSTQQAGKLFNPFLPDCKTTFSQIFYIFYAIF